MNILVYSGNREMFKELKMQLEQTEAEDIVKESIRIKRVDNDTALEKTVSAARQIDVIIIDINISTIEKAKEIHMKCNNGMLVLYSKNEEITYEMYNMYPLEILSGKLDEVSVSRLLMKICDRKREDDEKYIAIKTSKNICRIRKNEIYYIESDGHYLHIHTESGKIVAISKLSDFVNRLGNDFLQCHKSYAINIRKIRDFEYTYLTMRNDMVVQISRRFKKKVKEAILGGNE